MLQKFKGDYVCLSVQTPGTNPMSHFFCVVEGCPALLSPVHLVSIYQVFSDAQLVLKAITHDGCNGSMSIIPETQIGR